MTAAVGGVVEGRKTLLAMGDVDDKGEAVCAACVGVLLLLSMERRSNGREMSEYCNLA